MSNLDFIGLQTAVAIGKPLYSIFDRISLGHASGRLNNQHKLRPLTNKNIVDASDSFPIDNLKSALENDLQRLRYLIPENLAALSDTFFYLLHKYGWRIADPGKESETSLAVAYCDSYRVDEALKNAGEGDSFILVKGDLSGIQEYIYGNIQPRRAGGMVGIAKKLRGRSILVSLLTDFLANVVLRELGLPRWHLLFAGGGHFNLLLPATPQILGELKVLTEKLDFEMHRRFGDNLSLVMALQECSRIDINENTGACFSKINAELERQKAQQHHKYLHDHFFPPVSDFAERQAAKKNRDQWEVDIGERFPKCHKLIETVTDGSAPQLEGLPVLVTLEMHNHTYSLMIAEGYKEARKLLADAPDLISAQVFSFNDTEFLPTENEWQSITKPVSFGFRFLGKTVPTKPDDKTGRDRPKTFEEIVKEDALEMLAAMRLDVDDLGFIFSRGMKGASLAEIVTLSREIQYFFSAHFDHLAAQEKHDLYLIYSGGDDAFVAGKWDNLIAFAQQLHHDFQTFVFNNEDVNFSAGIFMGNPHYPIGKISRDAGRLQQASKDSNNRKNRISIFNHIMRWDSFTSKIELGQIFEEALEAKRGKPDAGTGLNKADENEIMRRNENQGKLSSSFAYRILQLVKSSFYERTGVDPNGQRYTRGSIDTKRFARNVENMRYLFARHGYDRKMAEKVVGELEKALIGDFLKSFDFSSDAQIKSARDYLVALNYALFKHRSKIKTEKKHD